MVTNTPTKKEPPRVAIVEVKLYLDTTQFEDMQRDGVSDKEIQKSIERAITLREVGVIQPVMDIQEVHLVKYY